MSRILVAGIKDLEGIGKDSQRPYKMRNVKVVATDADGVCEVGELTFFEGKDRPLPVLEVGKNYEPIFGFNSEKGKLTARIVSLKPILAAAARAAA